MTLNNDVFVRPPLGYHIPNDGVTEVGKPADDRQWDVLKYELESFVFKGEYEQGLQRILDAYLTHRSQAVQQAAWVSGFYGSGKSHLVRVLEHIWADTKFPDGASARGLANLPLTIKVVLKELDAQGKRDGAAPWSAAGSLNRGGAESLNVAVLAIVLRAAGLPTKIAPAQVGLWLHEERVLDAVRTRVETSGKHWQRALSRYNVNETLAEAILAERPTMAANPAGVLELLKNQFPDVTSLPTDQAIELLGDVLRYVGGGNTPPTLLVLDEVQQYISNETSRALEVQQLVEAVTKGTDGRVLIVATGQQELTADPTLQKIQDRFTVKVTLQNQDVDTVIRQVLLAKTPGGRPLVETALDAVAGEIARELNGVSIAHRSDDDATKADDYPLLPSRRRFWESVLRAADAGRAGQLRSQLRIVHEANQRVADEQVGTVIGADFLYEDKANDLNATGQLLKETQLLIVEEGQKDPLRGRVLGLIFLMSLLPKSGHGDIGVRPNAEHLADLLVEDLSNGGKVLRERVPELLAEMASEGVLQQDGDEYSLQTATGRLWEQDFKRYHAQIDAGEVGMERARILRAEMQKVVPAKVQQGASKVDRRTQYQEGSAEPRVENLIPVWVRSEWDEGIKAKAFEDEARRLGADSPIVLVHLRQQNAEALTAAIRDVLACDKVLAQHGNPQDEEGRTAKRSIESKRAAAEGRVTEFVKDTLDSGAVLLAGGSSPEGLTLKERLENATNDAVARLYYKFSTADNPYWYKVIDKVKAGSAADALRQVGHNGEPLQNGVVKEVLSRIGAQSTPANDIVNALTGASFGWPLDALRAAFAVLVGTGQVAATDRGSEIDVLKLINLTTRLGTVNLRRESPALERAEQIKVRGLLTSLGVPANADSNLAEAVVTVIDLLSQRARDASGDMPFPQVSVPTDIQDIRRLTGNARVKAFLNAEPSLTSFHATLRDLEKRLASRGEAFRTAQGLAVHAKDEPAAADAIRRLEEFVHQRELLGDVDAITPILNDLTTAVRDAVNVVAQDVEEARVTARTTLTTQEAFTVLDELAQSEILSKAQLQSEPVPNLSSPADVLRAVTARSLAAWRAEVDAAPARANRALELAVAKAKPDVVVVTVSIPGATVASIPELNDYVAKVRALIQDNLTDRVIVVVKGS